MPSKPRSEVIDESVVGVYHCWNRVTRRRHLLGEDAVMQKDFSYRKTQLRDKMRHLAKSMAVEVLDFAILDNHIHFVLRNRPDIVESWSDREVAIRWWLTCPDKRAVGSVPSEPRPCEIQHLLADVDEYRKRLSSISWMMRLACQPIAYRANREDDVDGRFFAKRFDCERLKTEEDVLRCSLYVDLNWIRAGMAETPEESQFTSAYDRIQAQWQRTRQEMSGSEQGALEEMPDNWLAPICLAPEPTVATELPAVGLAEPNASKPAEKSNPIGSARVSNKKFLSVTFEQYLTLLDTLGRVIVEGKRGAIPSLLPPILERLGIDSQTWFDSLMDRLSADSARSSPDVQLVSG